MPAKKSTKRVSRSNPQTITKANKFTVAVICACFVLVGIFLVYKTFAAAILGN